MKRKKFLAIALSLCLVFAAAAWALDWHTTNQATVAWDVVTTHADGTDIVLETNERLTYFLFLANSVTDPDKANPAAVGSTQTLEHIITLTQKGSYYVGIKSAVEVDDGAGNWTIGSESEVVWSDNPTYVQDGVTFGLRYFPAPNAPRGLTPVSG